MALNKQALIQAIKQASIEARATKNPQQAEQKFAEKLADAIDAFVRSGQVNTTVTLTSQTTGQGVGTVS